jgi:hypothetical protein
MTILIACGFLAFVIFTILFSIRERKIERGLAQIRGAQDVTSFAEIFSTGAERAVARALYPRLKKQTATRALPLIKEDRLFSLSYHASILSDSAIAHSLRFLEEDLFDEVIAVLAELGCSVPKTVVADELEGVETVGQLVSALAKVISQPVKGSW